MQAGGIYHSFQFLTLTTKKQIEDNYNMFFHSATVRGPLFTNVHQPIFGRKTLVHIESQTLKRRDDLTKPESLEINSVKTVAVHIAQ